MWLSYIRPKAERHIAFRKLRTENVENVKDSEDAAQVPNDRHQCNL